MKVLFEHRDFGKGYRLVHERDITIGAIFRVVAVGYLDPNVDLEDQGYEIEIRGVTEDGFVRYLHLDIEHSGRMGIPSIPLRLILHPREFACLARCEAAEEMSLAAGVLPFRRTA